MEQNTVIISRDKYDHFKNQEEFVAKYHENVAWVRDLGRGTILFIKNDELIKDLKTEMDEMKAVADKSEEVLEKVANELQKKIMENTLKSNSTIDDLRLVSKTRLLENKALSNQNQGIRAVFTILAFCFAVSIAFNIYQIF